MELGEEGELAERRAVSNRRRQVDCDVTRPDGEAQVLAPCWIQFYLKRYCTTIFYVACVCTSNSVMSDSL